MPIDVASGKKLAQQLGMSPPADWAGKEDQWYQQMLSDAVNAGDPRALQAAGLWTSGGEGSADAQRQGFNKDFMNAAPSSEWMGKRNPTPSELRRFAKESNQSEDYNRFSDAQLSAWIKKGWKGDHFENDFGDRVEKPTESGPNSKAAGYATGDRNVGRGGGGGGGGGGAALPVEDQSSYFGQNDPLQSYLTDLLSSRGGYFGSGPGGAGQGQADNAMVLQGGGVFWNPTAQTAAAAPAATPAASATPQASQNPIKGASPQMLRGTPSSAPITNAPSVSNASAFGASPAVGGQQWSQWNQQPQNLEDLMKKRSRSMAGNPSWQSGSWF